MPPDPTILSKDNRKQQRTLLIKPAIATSRICPTAPMLTEATARNAQNNAMSTKTEAATASTNPALAEATAVDADARVNSAQTELMLQETKPGFAQTISMVIDATSINAATELTLQLSERISAAITNWAKRWLKLHFDQNCVIQNPKFKIQNGITAQKATPVLNKATISAFAAASASAKSRHELRA